MLLLMTYCFVLLLRAHHYSLATEILALFVLLNLAVICLFPLILKLAWNLKKSKVRRIITVVFVVFFAILAEAHHLVTIGGQTQEIVNGANQVKDLLNQNPSWGFKDLESESIDMDLLKKHRIRIESNGKGEFLLVEVPVYFFGFQTLQLPIGG